MNTQLQARTDLFLQNHEKAREGLRWQDTAIRRLAALLYTLQNRPLEVEAIRDAHGLLRQSTGLFSVFRGSLAYGIAAMLSLAPSPEKQMENTLHAYEALRAQRLASSDHLAIAAYQVAASAGHERFAEVAERTRALYDGMKAQHLFITGRDDYIYAAMLALSDVEPQDSLHRMDRLFEALRPGGFYKNSLQALTQVLALGGQDADMAGEVLALNTLLKERRLRMDKEYTLPLLGILALLPQNGEEIAADLEGVYGALQGQSGLGAWSVSKQELLMVSAALVAGADTAAVEEGMVTTALSTNVTNLILAQQAAMIAIIAITTASTVSASSSSSSN